MKVYLSGGLKTNWQDEAIRLLKLKNAEVQIFDPRTLDFQDNTIEEIAKIENQWVKDTDVVLAFLEVDNLLPIGLSAELAFANALGKQNLLVDGYKNGKSRWLAFFTSSKTFSSLNEAINFLS